MAGFQPVFSTTDFNNGSLTSRKLLTGGFLAVKIRNFSSQTMVITDTPSDGTDQPFPIDTINPWQLKHLILDEAQQFIYIQPVPNGPTQVINDPYFTNQRVDYGTDNVPQVYESDLSAGMRAVAGGVTITSGSVDATVSGSVDIASGTVDATITNATIDVTAGTALPVEFPNAQQVNVESGNVDSNITNTVVNQSSSVIATAQSSTGSPGAGGSIGVMCQVPLGFYDSVSFVINSSLNDLDNYTIVVAQQRQQDAGEGATYRNPPNGGSVTPYSLASFDNVNKTIVTMPVALDPDFATNSVYLTFTATAAVTNETITVTPVLHYASTQVTNDTTNPVNNAAVPGSPFSSEEIAIYDNQANTNITLVASGGLIQNLQLSISNAEVISNAWTDISNVFVYNGSSLIAVFTPYNLSGFSVNGAWIMLPQISFGTGVPNNGIIIRVSYFGGTNTGDLAGYILAWATL